MTAQRIAVAVTLLNVLLLAGLLVSQARSVAATETVAPVLRAHALEIVDTEGRIRATISVEPAVTTNRRSYPEVAILRLANSRGGPMVKLTASDKGSALGLSDDAEGGVHLHAADDGSFVKVTSKDGREEVLKP